MAVAEVLASIPEDFTALGYRILNIHEKNVYDYLWDLKSHDPSQRANGFLTVAGGIIITFTKEILTMITG